MPERNELATTNGFFVNVNRLLGNGIICNNLYNITS